jgi:polysaccharide export outer membrane protein
MFQTRLLACLLVSVLIISCASTRREGKGVDTAPPEVKFEAQVKELEASKHVRAMNERILMSTLSSRKELYRDYRIGPEDLIEISVFEDEKLNKSVRVSSQGNISLPLLGTIRVKGLTSGELEKEIRDLLAEKYFQDPHVAVFIREYRSQQVSVIGAVDKPGVYSFMGQKTVLDALALAGGLKAGRESEYAGNLLFLIRPPTMDDGGVEEEKETAEKRKSGTFVVNLEELLVKGNLSLNLPVLHGDIINVPISGKVFVGGEVKSPGGFPLSGKRLTLNQVIAMAGGLKTEADGSEAKVFRFKEGGMQKETLVADIYAIQKGQKEDLFLQENDIVVVPKSGMKNFLIEFRDTVKGILGFGFSLGTL